MTAQPPGRGFLPVDDLARQMVAQESRRFAEDLETEAQLIAQSRRFTEVRPEHVVEALRRIGWKRGPDWLGRSLTLAGGLGAGIALEGFIAAWLDDEPDKMAIYAAIWATSGVGGVLGLLRRR